MEQGEGWVGGWVAGALPGSSQEGSLQLARGSGMIGPLEQGGGGVRSAQPSIARQFPSPLHIEATASWEMLQHLPLQRK